MSQEGLSSIILLFFGIDFSITRFINLFILINLVTIIFDPAIFIELLVNS